MPQHSLAQGQLCGGRLTKPELAALSRRVQLQEEKPASQKQEMGSWKFIRIELKLPKVSGEVSGVAFPDGTVVPAPCPRLH